jgi:predicted DNA-binding transcriptional regulator AlpA
MQLLEAVLAAPSDRREAILAAARGTDRPRPGSVRQAAEVLGVHPRTIERYARRGLLNPIRISPRRVRWDLVEVEALATRGVNREQA